MRELQDLLSGRRLVTLTGPGGIGKTALALEIARSQSSTFDGGVFFVELASLADGRLVPSAAATALGITFSGEEISGEAVARAIGGKKLFVVLDNCEHVVDAAANLAETLMRHCPHLTVLSTSREALRIDGEYLYHVPPLGVPPEHLRDSDGILNHSAVQLFIARTPLLHSEMSMQTDDIPTIAEICRRLDGIPLAIEFAAARAATLGVWQVAAHLGDRFRLLTGGRRTALPRHQTLRAALDWSYDLLPEPEQRLLRLLAIFPAGFTLKGAAAIMDNGEEAELSVVDGIASLVAKSLIVLEKSLSARWRLLETTRAYALEQLSGHGEVEQAARRHAGYCRNLLERAESDWNTQPSEQWLACYAPHIDDLRTALDWTLKADGDVTTGIALTTAAAPLWFEMWLLEECRMQAEHALTILENAETKDDRRRMQLYAAIAASQAYMAKSTRDTLAAWRAALEIAETLGDAECQLRALWGIWGTHVNRGEFKEGLAIAQVFSDLAARGTDNNDRLVGDRLTGAALHFLGDQRGARKHIERMLASYVAPVRGSHAIRFQSDQAVTARMYLARILWVQGYADQAVRVVEANIEDARLTRHPQSFCNALAGAACPIALLTGDLAAAQCYTTMLLDQTAREALELWHAHGVCFEGELLIRRGDVGRGLHRLQTGIDHLHKANFGQYILEFLASLAEGLVIAGNISQASVVIDDAIKQSQRNQTHWYLAELLRLKGEIVLKIDAANAAKAAQVYFLRSLDVARQQAALAWELRTAASLAQLWLDQDQKSEACNLLESILDRFTEGRGTVDVRTAANLLNGLSTGKGNRDGRTNSVSY